MSSDPDMLDEYDFSKMKAVPNHYFRRVSRDVTLRVGVDAIAYFDLLAEETGIERPRLMAMFLRDCAMNSYRPSYGLPSRKPTGTEEQP